ncbi:MAG: hypothetical protein UX45_C0032G0018 [Candidatus Uhrbacteria bacterium GW2011_GWF2_46_218]|uniref:Uncharacterized protein n=1 Tax=Candidatus Uhrbacteria bacterium GW2011_GWF2_46_218 TaxID=1619001 RepID=A0A0G1PDN8_9BACT|nr:MAG: hypothetical protein UX45_C0032G0018 [Candidatus Uhrbacteria bacterium GW2011_GWF2_46_218]
MSRSRIVRVSGFGEAAEEEGREDGGEVRGSLDMRVDLREGGKNMRCVLGHNDRE